MSEIILKKLFRETFNASCLSVSKLPLSGSNREYFRLSGKHTSAIGVYNPVPRENDAFVHFTSVFRSLGLKVPEVYAYKPESHIYIVEDLGDRTVYDYISSLKNGKKREAITEALLKRIIDQLIIFQFQSYPLIDFSKAFPRADFDRQSIMWDLNYFKYYFLKLFYINFDEQLLEDDFNNFAAYLVSAPSYYFMYRDFQSRNIMLKDNELYFIDYQGGRRGPLQYDLASLLYSARTNLSDALRYKLLHYYIQRTKSLLNKNDRKNFTAYYYAIVLVRILQALGAYGYRGIFEKKSHFTASIPLALNNLKKIQDKFDLNALFPELSKAVMAAVKLKL